MSEIFCNAPMSGVVNEPVCDTPNTLTSVKPTLYELKRVFLKNKVKAMALLALKGYDPVLRVITDTQVVEIPWQELPAVVDGEDGSLFVSVRFMTEVDNIEEAVIVGDLPSVF